jgi:hypothetical protein
MKLYRYLSRLQSTIYSRREIQVERLITHLTTAFNGRIWGRLRFYDGSLLGFEEKLTLRDDDIEKIDYRYHYQRADGMLVVRYDNAPHHPELPGFPNHRHTPTGVESAEPPDLSEVLKEIDTYLYLAESKT